MDAQDYADADEHQNHNAYAPELPAEFTPKPGPYEQHWNFRSEPRPQQLEVLRELDRLDAGEDPPQIILCDAPTGVGKSGLLVAVASKQSGIILTPQKFLQDQYSRDWPDIPVLKGSANYECNKFRGADCQSGAAAKCRNQACEYKACKLAFLESRVAITNYAYLFAALRTDGFNPLHNTLCFDEGHAIEESLIGAAEVHVTVEHTKWVEYYDEAWPESLDESLTFLEGLTGAIDVKLTQLASRISGTMVNPADAKQFVTLQNLGRSIEYFLHSYDEGSKWAFIINDHHDRNKSGFRCRPLYAMDLFDQFIKPLGKRIWLTSATLPPVKQMSRWLGIRPDDCHRIVLDSPFAIENRTVHYAPVAKMDRNNIQASMVPMVQRIEKLFNTYKDFKGVVHCHSFALTKMLAERLTKYHARILVQTPESDRQALIDEHINSPRPTILMSPSMTEGLDLYDDLSRFTIFPKVPFPNLGDPWVKARMEDDGEWYGWQTLKTIMQGCGRSVRHVEDYADAYIIDGSFGAFWQRSGHLAPKWFSKSIKW